MYYFNVKKFYSLLREREREREREGVQKAKILEF